jgi:c-di-GMP-related signal transduction protein
MRASWQAGPRRTHCSEARSRRRFPGVFVLRIGPAVPIILTTGRIPAAGAKDDELHPPRRPDRVPPGTAPAASFMTILATHPMSESNAPDTAAAQDIYLARQPIVDIDKKLVGYELLFRSAPRDVADHADSVLATSTVIANVFGDMGLGEVIGDVDGYLNIDMDFLFSELVEALPPERIVLELLEQRVLDQPSEQRCRELRKRGYRIALDGFVGNLDERDKLLPEVDIVKIDFQAIDPLLVPLIVKMVRTHKVRIVAEKVETPAQYEQAKSLGIDLFQGFHFARPELLSAKRAKPQKLALLRILSLAMGDAEVKEIEEEFKRHPSLAVNLLRLVNSAAAGMRQPVTSLRHALILMGRKQLRVWLQLLLYTADRGGDSIQSPLLQLAAVRGKMMELLAARRPGAQGHGSHGAHGSGSELAFITGILSLMDVLLEMPHADILKEMPLPQPVASALVQREGEFAELLTLTEGLERDDRAVVARSLKRLGTVEPSQLAGMQREAFLWAHELTSVAAAR